MHINKFKTLLTTIASTMIISSVSAESLNISQNTDISVFTGYGKSYSLNNILNQKEDISTKTSSILSLEDSNESNSLNKFATFSVNTTNLHYRNVLKLDFDNGQIINTKTNKKYSSNTNTLRFVNTNKGKGIELNGDNITIPNSDLGISGEENVTVSFNFKYGGEDKQFLLCAFGEYTLWFKDDNFGFNTGISDIYGIKNPFKTNEYVNVVAVFNKNDITKNKLYINGEKQELKQLLNTPKLKQNSFNSNLVIASWGRGQDNTIDDNSIIDEINIYKGDISDKQAEELSLAHRVPELSTSQVNNYAQLNWATEILDEDVLWSTGFEEDDYIPENAEIKSNSITQLESYEGKKSLSIIDSSIPNQGNFCYIDTGIWTSRLYFNGIYNLKPEMKFSASFKAKNTGEDARVSLIPESLTVTRKTTPFHIKYNLPNPFIISEDSDGKSYIKIENFDELYSVFLKTNQQRFIADRVGTNYQAKATGVMLDNFDVENKRIYLNKPCYYKKGEELQYVFLAYPLKLGDRIIKKSTDWTTYNYNGTMLNDTNYDIDTKGIKLIFETRNIGTLFIDDFRLGFATKVKLYRDNELIYEGYDAQYNDTKATDKVAPEMSDVKINTTYENDIRNIKFSFDTAVDRGSDYSYTIQSVSKSGKESLLSEAKDITVTSGLKGYSYVIDNKSNTIPDNNINIDGTKNEINFEINKTDTAKYYLHIKAIDNDGNVSDTKHVLIDSPRLTTEVKATDDYVRLDWSMNNIKDKTFKVYQKKQKAEEFQTVSTTNFDKVETIKVLNVYPENESGQEYRQIQFTTWDDKEYTLPISASLKQWMEEPKEGYPKGYGMGKIVVTPVTITKFKANPEKYLKDEQNNWKYNVLVLGIADGNGNHGLSQIGEQVVRNYIEEGYGVLIGHDTIRGGNPPALKHTNKLRDLINIKFSGDEGAPSSVPYVKGDELKIVKKGLLLNYPHTIGNIGDILVAPQSHSTHQLAYGDVWMKYVNATNELTGLDGKGTSNFYLTSWNNVAMIQTGHSIAVAKNDTYATEDEQKILANTIFYLNQMCADNYLDDRSGQDVDAPDKPVLKNMSINNIGTEISITFNDSQDNGSTYEYYVQSESKDGNNITLSNIEEATITSGVKGYSYVIDNNPDTIPDNNINSTEAPTITTTINNKDTYIHIKAIDNVGNCSETLHYNISDTEAPELGDISINSEYIDEVRNIEFTFKSAIDKGNVVSGLKGYSYVIDGNESTTPNDSVNLAADKTVIKHTISKDDTSKHYLHIKAIDNIGNCSEIKHILIDNPALTATIKTDSDSIMLEWNMKNNEDNIFKVYKKNKEDDKYQTISSTNFEKVDKIKVLNVYPLAGNEITFTTWKGETYTLRAAASLKKWMEEPNAEHPKGYGQGIIEVTPLTINSFNNNPEQYLKDENGKWKYDVLMFGSADSYGNQDLSEKAYLQTKQFIDDGYGVLFGHDTVTQWRQRVYFDKFKEYLNMKTTAFNGDSIPKDGIPWAGSDVVSIAKKGLITNFPWEIGGVGTKLEIPYTHSNSQLFMGDTWIKFSEIKNDATLTGALSEYTENGLGTNLSYVSTWNNVGMIQTGHAINRYDATADEQKILANTLFYLNQLSSDTYIEDKSGQDTAAPDKPTINKVDYVNNGTNTAVTFNNVKDNGSTYEYYVQSESKDGNNITLSNIEEATITSGLKGYSYVIDTNPNTIPDNNVNMTTLSTITTSSSKKDKYIHIKAIDNVGNCSETLHYNIADKVAPTATITIPAKVNELSIPVNINNIHDNQSGAKEAIISVNEDFSNPVTVSILNKTQVTTNFKLDESIFDKEEYPNIKVYIKLIDVVGNEQTYTLNTYINVLKPVEPGKPIIITPENNAGYNSKESVIVKWKYIDTSDGLLPQSKAEIVVTNTETQEKNKYTVEGTAKSIHLNNLENGIYDVNVTTYNETNKKATSDTVRFRYGIYESKGIVRTIEIDKGTLLNYISIKSKTELPRGTEITCKLYYKYNNKKDDFDYNTFIQVPLDDSPIIDKVITLPEKSSKIRIEYTLKNKDINKEITPYLDKITVYAR